MGDQLQGLLASYAIGAVDGIAPAGGTAGKCWRVAATSGTYFLRRRGPRTSSQPAIEFDHGLRRHLIARGVPTAAPIAKRSGATWVLRDGRAFELYPFVEGRPFRGERAELVETARALAAFHEAASTYGARGSYSSIPAQFAVAAPEVGGTDRMDDPGLLAAAFEQMAYGDPGLDYAVEQARRLARDYSGSVYGALPRWLIHGDYHPGNLLYSESGRVTGIFDLDWACEHTRSRDLADAVYFFASRRPERLDDSHIESLTAAFEPDLEEAALLLRTYAEAAPLAPEEVRAIPLALRARWLAMRLEGSAKVPPEKRTSFIAHELDRPLRWLERHAEELVGALL